MAKQYANQDVLCETEWVANNLNNPNLKILEVDYDVENAYKEGHIPGAHMIWWKKDINDLETRDIINKNQFENLMSRLGVLPETELLLYGDFNNWFAAFAFWVFKYYGFKDIRLMNGGRKKWLEEDRPLTKDVPNYPHGNFKAKDPDENIRTYLNYVSNSVNNTQGSTILVDVRSPQEFSGEITAPPEYPTEHAQRGGHIPGAVNIPWAKAVNEDGTFKSIEELKNLYQQKGITPEKEIISYCRIGERSSHTWFVLKYLLGYPNVKNYDGSWTEWGNMIGNLIEK